MSDINANDRKPGDSAYTPYDYSLNELKLINALGANIDIDFIFRELNIYEDLFSNVLTGDITISDSTDIFNRLNIHGNEFISISFNSPGMRKYQKMFRVYRVSDYSLRGTSNASFKLHFCSEEFLLNQQYYISRSFKENKLSDVIKAIARNVLKISNEKFSDANIEETSILLNSENNPLIIPNLKPLEAINWISSFSLSRSDLSSGFYFYENVNGFHFKSLDNLCTSQVKKSLIYTIKNSDIRESSNYKRDILDEMEHKQVFNILDTANNGGYASELLRLDLLNRTIDYEKLSVNSKTFKMLNEFLPYNLAQNRLGNSLNQVSSYTRMFPKFQDNLTGKWLLIRAARLAMLNNSKLHIDVPGDSSLSVGNVVNITIPRINSQTTAEKVAYDPLISGKYLITGLRHHFAETKYYCHAQLCKDSTLVNLNFNPPFNSGWKLATNS